MKNDHKFIFFPGEKEMRRLYSNKNFAQYSLSGIFCAQVSHFTFLSTKSIYSLFILSDALKQGREKRWNLNDVTLDIVNIHVFVLALCFESEHGMAML